MRGTMKDGDPSPAAVWIQLFGQAIGGGKSAGEATVIADVAAKAYGERFRAPPALNEATGEPLAPSVGGKKDKGGTA